MKFNILLLHFSRCKSDFMSTIVSLVYFIISSLYWYVLGLIDIGIPSSNNTLSFSASSVIISFAKNKLSIFEISFISTSLDSNISI